MVALLLILRDCGVAAKNTLFKHFLRSDRPQLSSACTKDQLSNVPSEIFNLKRNRPRNLHELICNFREQVARAGCKLLRANCQSKYQHCGGSLQSCAEENIRFDCNTRGPECNNFLSFFNRGHFSTTDISLTENSEAPVEFQRPTGTENRNLFTPVAN